MKYINAQTKVKTRDRRILREMQLTERETDLVETFRRLPPEAAVEFESLVHRMAEVQPGAQINWSDEWSDEDLRDFTAHSVRELERNEESK